MKKIKDNCSYNNLYSSDYKDKDKNILIRKKIHEKIKDKNIKISHSLISCIEKEMHF